MKKYNDMETTKFPPIPVDPLKNKDTGSTDTSEETEPQVVIGDDSQSDTEDDDASDVSGTVDDEMVEVADTDRDDDSDTVDDEMVEVADTDTDRDDDSDTVDVPDDSEPRQPRYFWGEPHGAIYPHLTDAFVSVSLGIVLTILLVSFWLVLNHVTTTVG